MTWHAVGALAGEVVGGTGDELRVGALGVEVGHLLPAWWGVGALGVEVVYRLAGCEARAPLPPRALPRVVPSVCWPVSPAGEVE